MNLMTIIAIAAAAQAGGKAELPRVTDSHFLVSDGGGEPVESTRVPFRPGSSCYNWVLSVPPENRELAVREVFELPGSARIWGDIDAEDLATLGIDAPVTAVSRDRSVGVTEFADSLADGIISHGWCVAEGDPVGPHRIRVFVGDRLLHDFRFEIVAESY